MTEPDATPSVYGSYYAAAKGDAVRSLEFEAVGTDWGGNGYTTVDQVSELIDVLRLGPDVRYLDLGAGAGWPGLYAASASGAETVLSDIAPDGMHAAAERARARDVDHVTFVAGSSEDVPFADATFDAVSHSDLLC